MKIAVAGKGGSGKTTIAGTLARIMAERGQRVVAIDDDSNPNLALTLGAGGTRLELAVPADDFIERFGVPVRDRLTLLVMGQPAHGGSG